MTRARIGVFASGGGSNVQAILDHFRSLGVARGGDIVVVASDRAAAGALQRASAANVATATLRSRRHPEAEPLAEVLERFGVDLLVLAGYLQLVPLETTQRFAGRLLNVHPAPLPSFGGPGMYGARVHRAVLAAGVQFSGPTVHFVDEEYDHGAVIAHWPVPVLQHDDEHSLAARVLRAEHLLYPRVVQAVASGRVAPAGDGRLSRPFLRDDMPLLPFDPALDDASLASYLELSS